MWTQAWRRLNKKGKDEGVVRKKARKIVKAARAIVGASLDEVSISTHHLDRVYPYPYYHITLHSLQRRSKCL